MKWISVKDNPPTEEGRYLVYEVKGSHAHSMVAKNWQHPVCCGANIAYFRTWSQMGDGYWEWDTFNECKCNPTYWMPLPKSPKED